MDKELLIACHAGPDQLHAMTHCLESGHLRSYNSSPVAVFFRLTAALQCYLMDVRSASFSSTCNASTNIQSARLQDPPLSLSS